MSSKLKEMFSMNIGKVRLVILKETSEMKISGGKLKIPLPVENFNKLFAFFRFGFEILLWVGKNKSDPSMSPVT